MISNSECKVDEKLYSALAKGCLQMNQPLKAVEVVRAAYQLPGHSLAKAAQQGRPIGIDKYTLEEVAVKLQAGTENEQDAFVALAADLTKNHGVHISGSHGVSDGTSAPAVMRTSPSAARLSSGSDRRMGN